MAGQAAGGGPGSYAAGWYGCTIHTRPRTIVVLAVHLRLSMNRRGS